MAGAPKTLSAVFARIFEAFARSLFLRQKFTFFVAKIKKDDLTTLCELTKAEKLTPVIDRQYPLADTSAAIAYVEEGHARGKVIITPWKRSSPAFSPYATWPVRPTSKNLNSTY